GRRPASVRCDLGKLVQSVHNASVRLVIWTPRIGAVALLTALVVWVADRPGAAQNAVRFQPLDPFNVPVGADSGLQAIALADLDGDGVLDLVSIDRDDDRVIVFRGNGDGTFQQVFDFQVASSPNAIAVADVGSALAANAQQSQDGKPDIVVGSDSGD